ncbi:MAG: RIP metalloprotease RseP [Ignavibacteriae bacterium]|jgi:regulator of sigma E protease|nr:RIP metalloprotease RseP [Ignavibacteriota bacterium]
MEIISTVFYFLIVIGVLVFVHEFGHFAAARLTGMRAEVFAFGMGYRLFGFNKVNGFTFGKLQKDIELGEHTDYRICAFPIGGYVKISGMVDESLDKGFINTEPQPWEYRSKPVWKRMIVITAGVIMNILLAFLIFYTITLVKGKSLTETTTIGYVSKGSIAYESGITEGDKVLRINGKNVEYWDDIQSKLYIDNLGESISIDFLRNGTESTIKIPKDKIGFIGEKNFGIYPEKIVPIINGVSSGKPAEKSGIQKGDLVTGFAGEKITNAQKLIDLIKLNANKETEIKYLREGREIVSKVTPSADSTIGIEITSKYEGSTKIITYNIFSAIPHAASEMYYFGVEVFFKSIGKVITGDIPFKKAIGGPVKIAQASAQSAEGGFMTFIGFVALLSMSLAVINILPFPALDGGHFMILLWEAIFRKPVSYKVQIVLQNVGFIILLAFMLFVIYNDIISIK